MEIKKILVCDQYIIKEKVNFFFLSNPLMAITYSNEDRILNEISHAQFDLIIIDMDDMGIFNSDVMGIFNIVQNIKKQSPLPFIFATTSCQEDIALYIKLINIEVYKYFVKPFNHLLLDQAIYDVLEG